MASLILTLLGEQRGPFDRRGLGSAAGPEQSRDHDDHPRGERRQPARANFRRHRTGRLTREKRRAREHPQMADYQSLLVSEEDGIAKIVINRPDKLNALSRAVLDELARAVRAVAASPTCRVAIVTGAGEKAFVAGADISEMEKMTVAQAKQFSDAGHLVCALIEQAPCPFIAAVNGFALGGGCELALACDFIYASDKARFGQPEVNLGVLPGFGGTQRLARRVGVARARELVYTGDQVLADAALAMGLVNAVVPAAELADRVLAVAKKIRAKRSALHRRRQAGHPAWFRRRSRVGVRARSDRVRDALRLGRSEGGHARLSGEACRGVPRRLTRRDRRDRPSRLPSRPRSSCFQAANAARIGLTRRFASPRAAPRRARARRRRAPVPGPAPALFPDKPRPLPQTPIDSP